ncbi:MAG: hypothetical protein PHS82_08130 [Lachnospiraceae bacterium]|nr:hypothetical protein [Lachnospiraceae bacterium]
MSFLQKMERKFGRYAIRGLTRYIVILFGIGYVFSLMNTGITEYLTLNVDAIFHGQVWRIITWLCIPPSGGSGLLNGLFFIIMLVFYYSIGNTLERTWGSFQYNVYILGGMLVTLITGFLCYFVGLLLYGSAVGPYVGMAIGYAFTTYYVCMSIFLGFAITYPDMQVMLYFVIPIKIKWMAYVYGAFILYDIVTYVRSGNPFAWIYIVAIVASLLNFLIFFLLSRNFKRVSPKELKRKQEFKKAVNANTVKAGQARHRCAVCGRTELDDPTLEFRYCSKCNGNYEYCQDHLFTHEHVK